MPREMTYAYKQDHPFEKRAAEAARIREKYPDRIPVICEKEPRSDIAPVDKRKYLIPIDLTVGQFVYVIRKRISIPPEKAIFIFVNNTLPPTAALMSTVYEQHKDEDGIVYMMVVQARKPNGSHAVRRPAPCSRWDDKVEQVEAPVAPMLLVDLPDDLLVQILASLTGSARAHRHKETPHECDLHHIKLLHGNIKLHEITFTEGRAIAEVCACCHVFATCARAAAKVVADRHGWRLLPVAGSTPMQHLSRLEQDTTLVRAILRQVNRDARPLPTVSLWVDEVSLGFIGALSVDAQVRLQHTLELGRLLIVLSMRVGPDDPQRDGKVAIFLWQLSALMMQPGTPLNASWLAACVFPLVEMHMAIENCGHRRYRWASGQLMGLLCFLEPSVLRSHPETFEWVQKLLKKYTPPIKPAGMATHETLWSAGLEAWNERCEAQGLGEGCDTETRESKLKAMLHSGVRGCFVRLSALGTPVGYLWSGYKWTERLGHDVFPAVYH